jgi:hypothetical protein
MKKDRLDKPYYFLTAEERFRLYIEALSRGDEAEVKRLNENCPQETSSTNQAAYTDRVMVSKEIVNSLCSALASCLDKLKMIVVFAKTLYHVFDVCHEEAFFAYLDGHQAGSRRAWAAAGIAGKPPGWRGQTEEPEMDREEESLRTVASYSQEAIGGFMMHFAELEYELLKEALTIWAAFSDFCTEELRTEPEKLVKAWSEPMLPEIEKLKKALDPPHIDAEELKKWKVALQRGWRTFV